MKTALINGVVITPNRKISGGIVMDGANISEVFEGKCPCAVDKTIDVAGQFITPGFVDIHTHGAAGCDFLDGTAASYITASKMHMQHGTTALMPTITTCSADELSASLDAYSAAENEVGMPHFIGAHLEGPYFSPEQAGAQDPAHIRNPKKSEYLPLLEQYPQIRRWSVAAELPGALEMGLELARHGVVAAVGHSDALYDDMQKAADYGYTLLTHFYSGMSGVKRINAYRHAGAIESGYLMDDFAVEIIADGHHLPASLLKLIYKVKGSSNICLITDSVSAAGMPDGTVGAIGGLTYVLENGVAKLPDRSAFAGSAATANQLIKTMVEKAEVPMCDAVKMLTLTPARVAKVDYRMGSLVAGKEANIAVFDSSYNVNMTIVSGKITHEA
ncbi:MAG: N-acetylglucosamine-6-phosphate deacetylase [Clostridia bacterium]